MEKIRNINRYWCVAILAGTLLFSCRKKDFPESVTTMDSNFYFIGTIDGNAVSLKAGVNKYYMYASHSLSANNLYSFISNLKPEGCKTCNNSLQIIVNDFKYSAPNQGAKIDSSLLPKSYVIMGAPFYAVQFRSSFNHQPGSYRWDFGDGTKSGQANPLHTYSSSKNYSVSLKINSTNGCQQYISNLEKIKNAAINPKISAVSFSTNSMRFSASPTDTSEFIYRWDFGDGSISSQSKPFHTYTIAGTYPVKLRMINKLQDTIYARFNVATQTNPMPCLTNYSIESVTQVSNPNPLSNIIINWTDENGDVFTSNNSLQPSSSSFKILSVEDYDLNENGEKTKKMKIGFTCIVYNGARSKLISNAEGIISVSYK